MTRNHKTLLGAFFFIVLLTGGYFGAKAYKERPGSGDGGSSYESHDLTSLAAENLVRIEVPGAGKRDRRNLGPGDLVLEKKDGSWALNPAVPARLDPAAMDRIGRTLTGLAGSRIIEENPGDYSVYGLGDGAERLIIHDGAGKKTEFFRGSLTPSQSEYYLRVDDDPRVYTVSAYSLKTAFFTLNDILDKTLIPEIDFQKLTRTFIENGNTRIEIGPRPENDVLISPFAGFCLTSPYKAVQGVNSEKFPAILEGVQGLGIREFVDLAPASLVPYGLDKPARLFLETAGGSYALLLGKTENDGQYAARPGYPEVFLVNSLETIVNAKPFDLVDKFALIINIDLVESLSVRGGESPLEIEIKRSGKGEEAAGEAEGEEAVESYYLNGRGAEEKSFKALYQAIIGLLMDAEIPPGTAPVPPASPGAGEMVIEYRLNREPWRASIRLIPYNRDFYALVQKGTVEFLVSRPQISRIYSTAGELKYLD